MQLVHQNGDRLFVTSLDISNRFGKQHKDVLEAVRNLDCSPEFGRRNFTPSSYNNSQNKAQPLFELTRDGFVFLCMGFTGPQAALWKERYIVAFNEMENTLRANPPALRQEMALAHEIGLLRDQMTAQNSMIMGLYQQLDGARRGHLRAQASLLMVAKRQATSDAKALVLALLAQGVARDEIARRTGKTLNHIRQIAFHARHDGQGELALGEAA